MSKLQTVTLVIHDVPPLNDKPSVADMQLVIDAAHGRMSDAGGASQGLADACRKVAIAFNIAKSRVRSLEDDGGA